MFMINSHIVNYTSYTQEEKVNILQKAYISIHNNFLKLLLEMWLNILKA